MSGLNFFRDLRKLTYYRERRDLSEYGSSVFDGLVGFVEECSFSDSKNARFICENWRLDDIGLRDLWYRRTGIQKSERTFRSQISNLSSVLHGMFPGFAIEAFLSSSEDSVRLRSIESAVELLSGFVGTSRDMFCSEVCDYNDTKEYSRVYKVDELRPLLNMLKPLTRRSIYAYLDGVDSDQLRYVLSVLDAPLYEASKNGANTAKLEILQALGVASAPDVMSDMESPYSFVLPESFSHIISGKDGQPVTEAMREAKMDNPDDWEKTKSFFADLFLKLRPDYLMPKLESLSPLMLQEILDGDYEVHRRRGISLRK